MKTLVLLVATLFNLAMLKAQVVLNEVYPDPGSGNHEFFEIYNSSTSTNPENLDNYTVITYYEESGNKSGFYILDMPNESITARNFYVVASANPFNVQGKAGITANMNWNSLPSGAALTKWEKNGSSYTQVAVPGNLNDFFVKKPGGGFAHHILIFKNGILINGLMGGANSSSFPAYLKAMPNLFVDMTGSSPDFTVNFNTIGDNEVEYVGGTLGTNNGYYRKTDGTCGGWDKSTSQAQHTPGTTNGSAAGTSGSLVVAAFISYGGFASDPSILNYNITGGSAATFPVTVQAYRDLGIVGQLDESDELIDSRVVNNSSAGVQQIILPNKSDRVMLVCKSPAGCYDNVIAVVNNRSALPVKLVSFNGNLNNNKISLQWAVAENETAYKFEIEKSSDAVNFVTSALVFGSEKSGTENYQYSEIMNTDKVFYRLRMTDKSQVVNYSKTLMFQSVKITSDNNIKIINNPTNDKLTISISSGENQPAEVKVYDMGGRLQLQQKVNIYEGNNLVSFPLAPTMKSGIYLVEINKGSERQSAKFIKQ